MMDGGCRGLRIRSGTSPPHPFPDCPLYPLLFPSSASPGSLRGMQKDRMVSPPGDRSPKMWGPCPEHHAFSCPARTPSPISDQPRRVTGSKQKRQRAWLEVTHARQAWTDAGIGGCPGQLPRWPPKKDEHDIPVSVRL